MLQCIKSRSTAIVLLKIGAALGLTLISGLVFMLVWNAFVVYAFGLPVLSFVQATAGWIFVATIAGLFNGSTSDYWEEKLG